MTPTRCSIAVCLFAALLSVACATPIAVHVDYDTAVDFSGYRTFRLLPDPPATGNLRADNPLLQERIRTAIGEQLELQGFVQAEDAQMLVGYYVSTSQKVDVRVVDSFAGYGSWPRGRVGTTTTEVYEYEQGTLVIDIADAARNTLVWRGIGEARVRNEPTPEQQSQRVREAVAEILGRFPPGSDG